VDQLGNVGTGDNDEVVAAGKAVGDGPEGLAQRPLHLVALHRAADLAADGDAKPRVLTVLFATGEGVENEVAGRMGGAIAIDAVELAAARQPTSLRRHLGSEALPPFAPASLQDRAAAAGGHPGSKAVGFGPLPLLWLVGPLHAGGSIRTRPK